MNKQIKWPLILIFAAFSFFSNPSFSVFNENPNPNWVEPKTSNEVPKYRCKVYGGSWWEAASIQVCLDARQQSVLNESSSYYNVSCSLDSPASKVGDAPGISCSWKARCTAPVGQTCTDSTISNKPKGQLWYYQNSTGKICPPDGFPDHVEGPKPESPQNPTHEVCFKPSKFKSCPLGFYSNAVAPMPGQPEECVPIKCPAKGQAVNNIKNLQGIIPSGQSGTYCDGLCNYSIETGGISYQGQQFASGVSLGTQCGQSPISGQKFTPLDKEKSCTEHTLSSGAIFLECTEGTDEPAPDPNNPDLNLDAKKVDPQPTIDPFTGIECTTVEDKMSCVGKNVTDAITKQTKDQAKLAAERHNKLLEAQKEITEYVERQQRNREEARKNDAVTMVEAIQEVNRTLQTGGGGGGGTGTIVGLEGLVSAVEGIGEGVNETSVETDSEPSEGIQSFYEAEYPNGFQDVWQKNKAAFENTEMNQYLDSWKLTATGAAPPMQLCFNVIMDFGCAEFVIDPRVFPFLRIIMLVSTAFLCRALIFGG